MDRARISQGTAAPARNSVPSGGVERTGRAFRGQQMLAAVLRGPCEVAVTEVPLPDLPDDGVRVRLHGSGICGSNLPVWEGRPWFQYPLRAGAPGHEGWGVVESVGSRVRVLREGDPVTLLSVHAFAEYDVAPENQVMKLPVNWEMSKPFPGEALGCAMSVVRKSGARHGDTVAVVGIGFLGAAVCRIAHQRGATVIGITRRETGLQTATAMGAIVSIPWSESESVKQSLLELTRGKGCDIVIEAAGVQASLDLASDLVRVGGRLVIAGYHQDGPRQVNMQSWNWRALEIVNAHERDSRICMRGVADAIEAVEQGWLDPQELITHTFELSQIDQGFECLRQRPNGFLKAVLTYE